MWELDHKEGWVLKNRFFLSVVLEKTPESPLDSKEIKPINPRWKSTLNIHWKNWCWSSNSLATWSEELNHWKRPWCWERLRTEQDETWLTEDVMVGWHPQHNGHELEQTLGDRGGQGSLECCKEPRVAKSQTRPSDWTTTNLMKHTLVARER